MPEGRIGRLMGRLGGRKVEPVRNRPLDDVSRLAAQAGDDFRFLQGGGVSTHGDYHFISPDAGNTWLNVDHQRDPGMHPNDPGRRIITGPADPARVSEVQQFQSGIDALVQHVRRTGRPIGAGPITAADMQTLTDARITIKRKKKS